MLAAIAGAPKAVSLLCPSPSTRSACASAAWMLAFDVETSDPWFSRRFYRAALDRSALVRPIGNTVYVMPPYVVGEEEIAHLAGAVADALKAALAGTS
ncbi:MAG: hypothetical protein U1E96_10125 [Azonexus sp.]